MKRTLTLLAALTFVAFNGIGQVTFGPKAGADFCILSTKYQNTANEPDDNDPINGIGAHIGGIVNLHFTDYIGLQPELVYSMRSVTDSYKLEYVDPGGNDVKVDSESTLTYNYFKIPLLLMFSPNPRISIYAGPQMAFLLGGKISGESKVTILDETTTTSLDVSSRIVTFDSPLILPPSKNAICGPA